MNRRQLLIAVLVTALGVFAIAATSVVYIPVAAQEGVIYACASQAFDDDNGLGGYLRIVESLDECRKREAPLFWNRQGPKGDKGADADLTQVMQANHGNVLTDAGTFTSGAGPYDMLDVPHFGPVNIGCEAGVATVKLTLPSQTYRLVWTTIDGGAPTFVTGYFTTQETVVAYGAAEPGAHVTIFRATNWDGNEEWSTTIEVVSGPEFDTECTYVITAASVRNYP